MQHGQAATGGVSLPGADRVIDYNRRTSPTVRCG